MRFSTVLSTLPFVGAAVAQTAWPVQVGANASLTFSPTTVTAAVNDTIVFTFVGGNHTATQSTFADPCTLLDDPNAWASPFEPAVGLTSNFPTFNVTVSDTNPMWFFCSQFVPFSHCEAGMVFAVNPPANESYSAFQAAAMALSSSSNTSSSSSSAPGPTSGAPSGAPSGSPSGSSSPSAGGSSTGAPAPSTTGTSGATALHAGAASMLLGGVSLLALIL